MTIAKKINIADFLTPAEIKQALQLYKQCKKDGTRFSTKMVEQIIQPNMARIDKQLGQENNPLYLAYAAEFVLMKMLV